MSITPKDQSIALIRRAQKILCLTQAQARADGIAAVLAFQAFGQKAGKEVVAVVPQGVGKNLSFLPGHEQVAQDLGEPGDFVISLSTEKSDVERVKYTIEESSVDILITPKNGHFNASDVSFKHNAAHFDLIILFDCPQLEALGPIFEAQTELFASTPTLNLAANPGTEDYAKVNLVDPTKTSSCEVLFDTLYSDDEFKTKIDSSIATCLLSGMVASTGSFLNAHTSASGLEAAAVLQKLGAAQSDIIEHLFKQKSFNTLKVWGRVFANLEVDPNHKVAWAYVAEADLKQLDAQAEDIDALSDEILRYTEDVDIAALAIESQGHTTVQVRSQRGNLNWRELAAHFETKTVEHGVDITIPEQGAATALEAVVQHLVLWQKQRLGVSAEVEIEKLQATASQTPQPTLPIQTVQKSAPVDATPPAEVPFVAPKQPHENQKIIPEEQTAPPGTQAAEFIVDAESKGIPEWLKKSFPKN